MFFKRTTQRVIILGLNQVSVQLARTLSLNNDVIILTYAQPGGYQEEMDVIIETIDHNLPLLLKKYQIEEAIFIALHTPDTYNLFAGQIAKKMGARKTIAVIYDDYYIEQGLLTIDMIFNPYQILLDKLNLLMEEIGLMGIKNLIPGRLNINLLQVKKADSFCYIKLQEFNWQKALIIAIKRKNELFIPAGDTRLFPGDIAYILNKKGLLNSFYVLKKFISPNRKLYIYGADELTLHLIDFWQSVFKPVVVIEPRLDKCNIMATKFSNILILQAEGTDLQLFREEGIDKNSIFLALSNNDFVNLLSSYGVRSLGCRKIFTLLNNETNLEIANSLKLPAVIFFPDLIKNYIISFLDTGYGPDRYLLGEKIYTTRINIKESSSVLNKHINQLSLPPGVVIGVIIRGREIIIPDGEQRLKANDSIIIFFEKDLINLIQKKF